MGRSRALASALLFFSFVLVSVVQSWPLTLSLSSSLTGQAGGDTGVYVWNLWVFRHELLQGGSPLQTSTIFVPGASANLSLHNYTIASNLVALPLQGLLGIVASFNVVYLLNVALAGLGAYVLARRLQGTDPPEGSAAWLAGAIFACSPFLVARSTAHFSLVAAAALPFFLVALDRTLHVGRARHAALVGASLAWAAYSDPYYAVYCVLLGLAAVTAYLARVEFRRHSPRIRLLTPLIDLGIGTALILVGVVAMTRADGITLGSISISVRSLYTPVLVLTILIVARAWMALRPQLIWTSGLPPRWLSSAVVAVVVATVLLGPMIVALIQRAFEGDLVGAPVLWRSSAPGVDLVSFFLPNPNHPLAPEALVDWVNAEPGRFEENVVSVPWTAIGVIVAARLLIGQWGSRLWLFITVAAASLALGPFIRIAGVETYVATPWALLRYVPLLGEARMPPRFGVIVILGVAVLFAGALSSLVRRYPNRRRALMVSIPMLLAVELLPAPRLLYPATFPSIYSTIERDPRPVAVLELPTGVRDGLSSLGDFAAISQFYQTSHGKPIIGGYLSRVSDERRAFFLRHPFPAALVEMSAGRLLTPDQRRFALDDAETFIRETSLGYVVIDNSRTIPELRELAITALGLREVAEDGSLHLYVPDATASTPGLPLR